MKAKRDPGKGDASGHQRTPSHHKQSSSGQWREDIDSVDQDHHSTSRTNQDHLHSIAEQRFTELIGGSSQDHPSLNDPVRSSVDSVTALSNEDASRILRNVSSRSNKASKQADMFDSTSHVAGTTNGDNEEHRASAALDGSDSKHVSTNSSITSMNSDPRLGAVVAVAQRPSDGIRSSADIISQKVEHSAAKTNLRSSGGSAKNSRRNGRRSFVEGSSVGSSINLSAESVGSAATPRPDEEISEIDKRIQALQAYLDNAR